MRVFALLLLAALCPGSAYAYTCSPTDDAGCPLPDATCFVDCNETDIRSLLREINGCPANTTASEITIAMGPDSSTTCGSEPIAMSMAPTYPQTATGSCGDDNGNLYNALCITNNGVVFDGRGAIFTYVGDQICASCDGECELCASGFCSSRQPALFVLKGNRNTVKNLELRFFPEGLHIKTGSGHTIANVTAPYVCEDAITVDSTSAAGHRVIGNTLVGNTNAASGGGSCWSRKEGSTCTSDADCAAFAAGTRCYCGLMSQLGSCASSPPPPLWPSGTPGQCFAPSPCGIDKAIQVNGGESTIGGGDGEGNRIHAFGQPVHVITGTHTIANNVTCGDHADKNVCQAYDVSGGSVTFVGNWIDHCKFGIRVVGAGQADADGNVITNDYVSAFQVKGVGDARLRGEHNLMRNNGYTGQSDCQLGAIVARDNPNAALDFGGGDFGGAAVFGGAVSVGENVSCQAGPRHLNHLWNVTDCPCALDANCYCALNSAPGSSCGGGCGLVGPCCARDVDGACRGSAGGDASAGMGAIGVAANWFAPMPTLAPEANPNVIDRAPVRTRIENANPYGACNTIVVPECECFRQADGTACTDGDACTQTDTCQAGTCTGANPVVCAADQCHDAGVCDPASGTCSNPEKADGSGCNDGLFCTVNDACSAGVCRGAARDCSTLADQCNDGTCDEFAHQCEATPKTDGTACSDGDLCTENDACQAGVCFGTPRVCDDANPCTVDSCDPSAGCVSQPVTGLAAATCLLIPDASCHPMPPALAKAIAQVQSRIASAGATQHQGRAKKMLGQASYLLQGAAKKAARLAKKRHLAPACSAALQRNLLEASSRIAQLEKAGAKD